DRARAAGQLATAPPAAASVEAPKDPAHGDAASNAALVMARAEKKPPRAVAEGERFWRPQIGAARKVQVEFLSANPTGPLTVGHGRNAVLGDTLARMFAATGFRVTREYYFNDGGRQMKLLGESVRVRYLQEFEREATLPEDGYQGEYIREIARKLVEQNREGLAEATDLEIFRSAAVDAIMTEIRATCAALGVTFDQFTNERDLMEPQKGEAVSRVDAVL